jgi:hypothetical protein
MTGEKLSQAHGVMTKPFYPPLTRSKTLSEVGKMMSLTEGQGDKEGAS